MMLKMAEVRAVLPVVLGIPVSTLSLITNTLTAGPGGSEALTPLP